MSVAGAPQFAPIAKARLGFEIVLAYCRVRRSVGRHELPQMLREARQGLSPETDAPALSAIDAARLGRAVMRTLRLVYPEPPCLTRSLVLISVLARRGTWGDLVIAVQPTGTATIDAHAWVEHHGRALLPPAPQYQRLLCL